MLTSILRNYFKLILYFFFLLFSLFLGICSSERAAEANVQLSIPGSPVIGLRFNSIRIDYTALSGASSSNRAVKLPQCAVRVDIYNGLLTKKQNQKESKANF